MTRRRHLAPYLTATFAIAILAGVAVSQNAISVPVLYLIAAAGLMISAVGFGRWEDLQDLRAKQRDTGPQH